MEDHDREPQRYPLFALVVVMLAVLLTIFLSWPLNNYAWFFLLGFGCKMALDWNKE